MQCDNWKHMSVWSINYSTVKRVSAISNIDFLKQRFCASQQIWMREWKILESENTEEMLKIKQRRKMKSPWKF